MMKDSYRLTIKCCDPAKQGTRSSARVNPQVTYNVLTSHSFYVKRPFLRQIFHLPVLVSHKMAIWWVEARNFIDLRMY